jgi:hypothetical protein
MTNRKTLIEVARPLEATTAVNFDFADLRRHGEESE